jgi:hypothetical protein
MVGMLPIGMSNLVGMIVLSAVIVIYKLALAPTLRRMLALSTAAVAFGVIYAVDA